MTGNPTQCGLPIVNSADTIVLVLQSKLSQYCFSPWKNTPWLQATPRIFSAHHNSLMVPLFSLEWRKVWLENRTNGSQGQKPGCNSSPSIFFSNQINYQITWNEHLFGFPGFPYLIHSYSVNIFMTDKKITKTNKTSTCLVSSTLCGSMMASSTSVVLLM